MGYFADLKASTAWLVAAQREDGGWGLAPGQASSLVNTAEALFILSRTRDHQAAINRGLSYTQANVFGHLQSRGPRTRYAAFSLMALVQCDGGDELIDSVAEWLFNSRNEDHGWGVEEADGQSELFSTSMALLALQQARWPEKRLRPSLQWILARAGDSGWSLQPDQTPTPVASAYAVLCLAPTSYANHDRVRAAKHFLLQTSHWEPEEEVIAGTVWKHCTYAWVIPALIATGENPYSPVIAEGVRYVNRLRSSDGGWSETEKLEGRTVRAQYWAVVALDAITSAFDAAVHVPRIDAERAQESLSEPYFVKIAMRSRWAVVVPAALYRGTAYSLLTLAALVLFGAHRGLDRLPEAADSVGAIVLLVATWFMVQKRPRPFPRFARWLQLVIGLLALIDLAFGVSIATLLRTVRNGIVWSVQQLLR